MTARRPATPEVRLERLAGQAVAEGGFDKAILPIGATEYHGPAFPYGTDTITAETLAEAFARELGGTLVLPALAYGVSHHHLAWPWTLSLRPDTLALVVRDIAESLLQHGIRKLLIVSAHDGNPPAAIVAARNLSQDHDMSVAIFSGWQGKSRAALAGKRDIDLDHAGQSEMSMVLYAAPETARLDLATHEPNQRMDQPIDLIGGFKGTVPKGYSGNAAAGTPEEGEAIVRALTALVVPHLRELDANGWQRGGWMSGIDA
jgi:creatinine amidohydrolase